MERWKCHLPWNIVQARECKSKQQESERDRWTSHANKFIQEILIRTKIWWKINAIEISSIRFSCCEKSKIILKSWTNTKTSLLTFFIMSMQSMTTVFAERCAWQKQEKTEIVKKYCIDIWIRKQTQRTWGEYLKIKHLQREIGVPGVKGKQEKKHFAIRKSTSCALERARAKV